MDDSDRRGVWISDTPPATLAVKGFALAMIGRRASVGRSAGLADWPCILGTVDKPPGGVWIDFIRRTVGDSQSIVAMPVTGSLVSPTLFSRRDADFSYRSSRFCVNCDMDWILPAGYQVLLLEHATGGTMDADGFSIVDNRAGVMFGSELYVPWDAPEINLSSSSTVPLQNVPDVFGMSGRRDSAKESCILQGRDARSIQVLDPDFRGLDRNFHDVTVVDMGDLPESQISMPEVSDLASSWPPAVITHMRWRQPELEELKQGAIPEETAGGVQVLWHHDQVRYVPACGALPLRFGSVVEVPGVVVHRLEGCTTRFDGPCSWIPQSAGGSPNTSS